MKKFTKNDFAKIFIAIFLIGGLLNLPYGYYQLMRFVAFAGFMYLFFKIDTVSEKKDKIFYIFLAILFQPFFKITLGRNLWKVIDLLVACGLILTLIKKSKNKLTSKYQS